MAEPLLGITQENSEVTLLASWETFQESLNFWEHQYSHLYNDMAWLYDILVLGQESQGNARVQIGDSRI